MSSFRRFLLAASFLGCLGAPALAQPADSAAASAWFTGVRGTSIVIGHRGQASVTVPAHGKACAFPAFSPDGTRVAFVQAANPSHALSDLVIVDRQGGELKRIAIEPVRPQIAYAGMRYVEGLSWVTEGQVEVHGSLNPSQSQYYVFNTATGATVRDFVDDQSAPAFSPDGQHVVTLAGSPHFAGGAAAPKLMLDDHVLFPAGARPGLQFAAAPAWSADSTSVAWAFKQAGGASLMLGVWSGGSVREVAVPVTNRGPVSVGWDGARVIVRGVGAAGHAMGLAYSFDAAGSHVEKAPPAAASAPASVEGLEQVSVWKESK